MSNKLPTQFPGLWLMMTVMNIPMCILCIVSWWTVFFVKRRKCCVLSTILYNIKIKYYEKLKLKLYVRYCNYNYSNWKNKMTNE